MCTYNARVIAFGATGTSRCTFQRWPHSLNPLTFTPLWISLSAEYLEQVKLLKLILECKLTCVSLVYHVIFMYIN